MKNKQTTLCWSCAKAGGGNVSECPWAREFKPVEGWTATETHLRNGEHSKPYTSYRVTACPLFVPDPRTLPKPATPEEIANVKRAAVKEMEGLHGKERKDARRAVYKKFHICIKCANAFAAAGYTMCPPCRIKHAAQNRKERIE